MSSTDAPPSKGLIAGKYELLGIIGRGGMGSVWEGRHASLGTRVAIKFIESEFAQGLEARARFDTEARAAAAIQSKHAIQIFDHGVTDDGKPYIVMELLTGEPLDKRIERKGRLSLEETARILQQVCRGLQRAHERGIVHRDLKPENIFLVRSLDDDEEIAKVLDFGIAKIKSPDGMGISSSTKTGAVLGTPFFMSPEQARGLRGVDQRSDVWSIGVIAFKCVTGVLPFDGESVGDLLVKICTADPPAPSQLVSGLPPTFDAWFARALQREPADRFGSVSELSDALANASGISIRRRTGSGHSEATPAPPILEVPATAAYGTSAPFTQSTPTRASRTGRSMLATYTLGFVALCSVGFFVVNRFATPRLSTGSAPIDSIAKSGDSNLSGAATELLAPSPSTATDAGVLPSVSPVTSASNPIASPSAPSVTVSTKSPKRTTPPGKLPFAAGGKTPLPPIPPPSNPSSANEPGY